MEPDIYYYLPIARKQIQQEMQMQPDYLICKLNGVPVTVTVEPKKEQWPKNLVPSLC